MRYRTYPGFKPNPVWILIALNSVVFIATAFVPELIFVLALQPARWLSSPWTVVTSLFLHGGLGHITANMLTLYFFGTYLVGLIGERRFLIVYFGGGILGNILFILLASPYSIVVGASGAVFALGAALAVMRPKLTVFIFPIPVPIPLWLAIVLSFLFLSLFPNVAWQAHLGGLAAGLLAGYIFRKRETASFWFR